MPLSAAILRRRRRPPFGAQSGGGIDYSYLELHYGQSLSIGTSPAGTYADVVSSDAAVNITNAVVSGGKVTITAPGHDYANDDPVFIKSMGGMTQPNYASFLVGDADIGAGTFTLKFMDGTVDPGTGYGSYTSGGTVKRALRSSIHRMLSGGVRPHMNHRLILGGTGYDTEIYTPTQAISLKPLHEEGHWSSDALGETFAYGMGLQLEEPTVFFSLGRAAQAIQDLSRTDLTPGQFHFKNCIEAAKSAYDLLLEDGKTVSPKIGVMLKQGEADGDAGTTAATWKSRIATLKTDLAAGFRHVIQQEPELLFMMDQLAQKPVGGGNTYAELAQAAADIVDEDPDITVVGPTYWLDFANNGYYDPHLAPAAYRYYGEYLGYIRKKLRNGETWFPCRITSAVRSSTTITVTGYVPEGAITVDTTWIGAQTNYGFVFTGGGASITAVNIIDDGSTDHIFVIEITLSSASAGTLDYAMDNGLAGYNGRLYGPRGNIRGTSTFVAAQGSTACHPWLMRYRGTIA